MVKLANTHKIPVYPRGSGTSLSGGPLPVKGGMVLDMTLLRDKLIIDRENMLAIVSPGVITADIHKKAEEAGLFLSAGSKQFQCSHYRRESIRKLQRAKGIEIRNDKRIRDRSGGGHPDRRNHSYWRKDRKKCNWV